MITKCADTIKMTDAEGHTTIMPSSEEPRELGPNLSLLWKHCMSCLEHCVLVEKSLSKLTGTTFPVIIGRRPASAMPKEKENFPNSPQMVNISI